MNVPWSTLRSNPRDIREKAAALEISGDGDVGEQSSTSEDSVDTIAWDVTEFGRRMAFGGIVSILYCVHKLLRGNR